jgi:hypothetical protein
MAVPILQFDKLTTFITFLRSGAAYFFVLVQLEEFYI